jgi:N12 class adenine-specific DNA methylase
LSAYYLSGNVREKLIEAEAAAKLDPIYEPNVRALKAVQPEDVTHTEIDIRLGSPWVPGSDYAEFFADLMRANADDFEVHWLEKTGRWILTLRNDRVKSRVIVHHHQRE